jgi:hypothetical protein
VHGQDPEFSDWLKGRSALNDMLRAQAQITDAEAADPKTIKWWPNPGRMPKLASGERATFLGYLNDWFYKELSGETHLSVPGLAKRAGALLGPDTPERDALLDKSRSDSVFTTMTLVLAHMSELESEFGWGFAPPLRNVWQTLIAYWPAAESWQRR